MKSFSRGSLHPDCLGSLVFPNMDRFHDNSNRTDCQFVSHQHHVDSVNSRKQNMSNQNCEDIQYDQNENKEVFRKMRSDSGYSETSISEISIDSEISDSQSTSSKETLCDGSSEELHKETHCDSNREELIKPVDTLANHCTDDKAFNKVSDWLNRQETCEVFSADVVESEVMFSLSSDVEDEELTDILLWVATFMAQMREG